MIGSLTLSAVLMLATTAPAPPAAVKIEKLSTPEKALVFTVTVPASVDDTWQALTTTAGLETWLWRDVRVELRPGGDWLVLYPGGKTAGGTIVSFEPERRIELRAMAPEWFPHVRAERTTAVFELASAGPTTTVVTLRQTGWKQGKEWDDAYDYLAQGNAQLLGQLLDRFTSGPQKWPDPAAH